MAFESGGVPGDWRSAVIVPLYKGRVIGGLIDDEQGGYTEGRGCVDQIFTLKQIGEKAQ